MVKKVLLILLIFSIGFSFASCIKEATPEDVKLCEMCNEKKGTVSAMGTMFDDNSSHLLCDSCWRSYCAENNVIDGGRFNG